MIDALVDPAHAGPSAALRHALQRWAGRYYWSDEPEGRHLILTRRLPRRRRERWVLHAALFLTTLVTTTFAGAVLTGAVPYDTVIDLFTGAAAVPPGLARAWATGLVFSLPLLTILMCHELGHYVTARWHLLDVSPPYFIPVPLFPSFIGTMGAFIRLRTLLSDRRQLLDVGVAGPIAGFAVALPLLWIGLTLSQAPPGHGHLSGMLISIGGVDSKLGDSLITLALREVTHGSTRTVLLHPLAFAGWVGMFVTMLNLLPISQLDGGHIFYSAIPRWHTRVAVLCLVLILALGLLWIGWLLFGTIVLLLSRGRLGHPPVLDAYRPLPRSRRWLAWAGVVLLVVTFSPVPFRI